MQGQEILQDSVFILLYGGVIMLHVIAALYLLLRRSNAIAPAVTSPVRLRRWTAAFMAACALSHLLWLFYVFHPSPVVYVLICTLDVLTLFPSIAGILLSMLQDRHRRVWPVWVMLIPTVVLSVLSLIHGNDTLFVPLSIYVIVLFWLMVLYMLFAVQHYKRWLKDNYADLENKEIWQSLLILVVFLLFFVIYSRTTDANRVLVYLLQIDCIVITLLLLWRVETLQQLSESTQPEAEPAEDVQKASLSKAVSDKIGPLLNKHCENEQLYLQNDLTLAQLAQTIGTNRYYLSQYFAQQGISYNAYINGLRICHFIRLYQQAAADHRTVTAQQLAFDSGYRSYSTFSAAFKQHTGKNVTAWMKDQAE